MILTTSSAFGQFLNGVRAKFYQVFDQGQAEVSRYDMATLFETSNNMAPILERLNATGKQKIEATATTGLTQYLQPTGESQPFKEMEFLPGYITSVQPFQFTGRIRVSRQSVERVDSDYRSALDQTSKLKGTAAQTLSKHYFDVFNYSRTAQASLPVQLFGYGDTAKLTSVLHTDKISKNRSNILSTSPALSPDSIESMVLLGYNTVSDTGKPMPFLSGPKWLVVPPANGRKAQEIAQTPNSPYTSNFIANIFQGIYNVLTSPFLTAANGGSDTRAFLIDGNYSPIKQVVFKDVTMENDFDFNNKTFVNDVSAEWKVGPFDYRGLYATEGTGATISD